MESNNNINKFMESYGSKNPFFKKYINIILDNNEERIKKLKRGLYTKIKRDEISKTWGHYFKRKFSIKNTYKDPSYDNYREELQQYNSYRYNNNKKKILEKLYIDKEKEKENKQKIIKNIMNISSKFSQNNNNLKIKNNNFKNTDLSKIKKEDIRSLKKLIKNYKLLKEKLKSINQTSEYNRYFEANRQLTEYRELIKECKKNLSNGIELYIKFEGKQRNSLFKELNNKIKEYTSNNCLPNNILKIPGYTSNICANTKDRRQTVLGIYSKLLEKYKPLEQ
jgi:hypothetical protein